MDNFGSKQPYEAYYVAFEFANVMDSDDTIASATVTAMDGVSDVTSTVTDVTKQNIDGTVVNVWVKAGTTAKTYTITCKIVTTITAEKFEAEAGLPVLET